MRIGIFGGSFDPPHLGHLLSAVDATDKLNLDRLLWVPTAQQPDRVGHTASPEQRLEMVRATIFGYPKFAVSTLEIDRKGLSYTVATVEAVAEDYPEAERFLLVGTDAWARFYSWYEPDRIRRSVQVVVLARSLDGIPYMDGSSVSPKAPDHMLETRIIEISSTEVRDRVKKRVPINGFVSDRVMTIIESEGLYTW